MAEPALIERIEAGARRPPAPMEPQALEPPAAEEVPAEAPPGQRTAARRHPRRRLSEPDGRRRPHQQRHAGTLRQRAHRAADV